MYESILLPTDGSDGMASAIKHGFHQAQQHETIVHALYVVDIRTYMPLPDETQLDGEEHNSMVIYTKTFT